MRFSEKQRCATLVDLIYGSLLIQVHLCYYLRSSNNKAITESIKERNSRWVGHRGKGTNLSSMVERLEETGHSIDSQIAFSISPRVP